MLRARHLALLVPLSLAACAASDPHASAPAKAASSAPPTPPRPPAPPPPPARADARLPREVEPLRYRLVLDVDPARPRFTGTAEIAVRVAAGTHHVVLHGRDLALTSATARQGEKVHSARVVARVAGGTSPEELVLTFDEELAPGDATLALAWDAPFGDSLAGLYRVEEEGRWYAFTQFEATDARRAFPCFDEPGWKTPFEVTVRVPRGLVAVANAKEASRTDDGDKVAFRFAATPPLPTYLVALAVGELDVTTPTAGPVPVRVVTTRGKAHLGALAAADAVAFARELGAWFDVPYPYGKLDLVAVPDFRSGAMENAGLVTFREEILLLDEARATVPERRNLAGYMGHELAHMWFGDLVTMKWWDDLWLNEGFASWLEEKVTERVHPGANRRLEELADLDDVMSRDGLASARAVRQAIASSAQADEAFDGFTYAKADAVIGMLERWLGEATFQAGVRAYVRAHAHGNATADDLFAALGRASGKDVAAVAATFLDRPGVPAVEARPRCDKGRLVAVEVAQRPWTPLGSGRTADAAAPWKIPACVKVDGRAAPVCGALDAPRATFPVEDGGRCPAWVWPNAGETGYYRSAPAEDQLAGIARALPSLEPASKVLVLASAWAEVRAGRLPAEAVVRLLPRWDAEHDRIVLAHVTSLLEELRELDESDGAALRRYAGARLKGYAKLALGPAPEDPDLAEARADAFFALGDLAEHPVVLRRAEALASAWLAHPEAAPEDPSLLEPALDLAARRAGPERLEALRAAARAAKLPSDRVAAVRALFAFRDPALLERALDLGLTDEVRQQDFRSLFRAVEHRPAARAAVAAWTRRRWPELVRKLSGRLGARAFAALGGAPCTDAARRDLEAFAAAHAGEVEGGEHAAARTIEHLAVCASLHAKEAKATTRALAAQAPPR